MCVGYVAVFVYGLIAHVGTGLMHICAGCLFSAVIILGALSCLVSFTVGWLIFH